MTVLNRQRSRRVNTRGLARFLERAAREEAHAGADSMAVCLVSEQKMRELNRTYRGMDSATDVLSFRSGKPSGPVRERYLGDVVISVPTAARQALARRHSLARELKQLAVHGYLHLLGHDHETDDGRMLRLQRGLLRRLLPRARRRR